MANEMIKFFRGLEASLPETGVNGGLYITTDEGAIYLGTGTGMKRLGDFVQVANVAALPAKAHESCLYYCVAENILAKWNGAEWKQVNKQPTTEELKTLLGLGTLAYKSEVAEADLNADLKAKVNAAAEGNHSHSNKALLDTYTQTEADLADAVSKKHTHTFADTDVEDAIAKKHAHTFVEAELNKIADGDVANWNEAYAHSQADHAPVGAQANIIESVKVNGTALEIKDKAVDITVPTGALADKDEVAKTDLAEALATEIDNKVEKETGKSLVDDDEIAKLAGVSEGANKVENVGGGKIKIDGEEVTVYAHPDKHAIADVDGLQDALDGKQAAGDYAAEEHTHTKDEITDFAHTHTKSEITDFAHTHTASEITDFATEVAKVKVDTATSADSAKKVDNALTVKVGGVNVVFDGSAAQTADVDAAIEAAIDAIPEQTDYTVTITETTDGLEDSIAKKYTFTQNGAEIGTINLAKELVVTAGSVKAVTEADAPYSGAKVGDKYIELVIANQEAPIYVPAKDLVDIYTAKADAAEVQVAISNTNEISATLVNGGITEEKLAEGVKTKLNKVWEEIGVAQGLVNGLANGQVETNKEAIENITKDGGLIATAKSEAITEAGKLDEALHTAISKEIDDDVKAAIDAEVLRADGKYEEKGVAAGLIEDLDLANTYEPKGAEERANAEAARLDGLLKTELQGEIDADVKVVADDLAGYKTSNNAEVAKKANAADVYAKTETFTKDEVNAAIAAAVEAAHTWGSF